MNEKNTVNITISVTPAERKALKQAALDNDVSVSALIRSGSAADSGFSAGISAVAADSGCAGSMAWPVTSATI